VREHLLFRSIYHSFSKAWGTRNQLMTICQIQVPSEAVLRFAVEIHQPVPAATPAKVHADVWLWPDEGQPVELMSEDQDLLDTADWGYPGPREAAIDLSAHADEIVTLILRSRVDGLVPSDNFDVTGLNVMWDDARVQSPDYFAFVGPPSPAASSVSGPAADTGTESIEPGSGDETAPDAGSVGEDAQDQQSARHPEVAQGEQSAEHP
jgi:hypothetical protein